MNEQQQRYAKASSIYDWELDAHKEECRINLQKAVLDLMRATGDGVEIRMISDGFEITIKRIVE